MTPRRRRLMTSLWTAPLICLFLLAQAPAAPAQTATSTAAPTAADLPALVRQLKDRDPRARADAARRLVLLRTEAKDAAPALVEALADADDTVRYRSVMALGNMWFWLHPADEVVAAAVPALAGLLKDRNPETRLRAAYALTVLGPRARAAAPALSEALKDADAGVRGQAKIALERVGRATPADVPALVAKLKDKDPKVRYEAAERLNSLGSGAKDAAPALVEALADPDSKIRFRAALSLGNLFKAGRGPEAGAAVPALAALLKDGNGGTRWAAAAALSEIGTAARAAVPALIETLGDADESVRSYAALGLRQIGRDAREAAPALTRLLKDPSHRVRYSAAIALGSVEPAAAGEAVSALVADLRHEHDYVRANAAHGLRSFGPAAKAAVPALALMLKDPDPRNRHEAAEALGAVGPGAGEAAPALLRSLNDSMRYVRASAAVALLKVAPESEARLQPALLEPARARIEAERKAREGGGGDEAAGGIAPPPRWDEASGHLDRGDKLRRQGDLDAALASYAKALEIDPHYAEVYERRAAIHLARGNQAAALADYAEAGRTDAEAPGPHYYARGRIHLKRSDYAAAIVDFTEALRHDPYFAAAYYGRGLAHHWKGDHAAALADYDRALDIIPPAVEAFALRGRIRLGQGRAAEALADFDEAVRANPKKAANHLDRGDALLALGRPDEAEASYREALRAAPDDPQALAGLGRFLVEHDRGLAEALGLLRRAAEAQPDNAPTLHALGLAHLKLGQPEEAERRLSESVRRDGRSALAHEHLGDAQARRGRGRQAQESWRKALSLSSGAADKARLEGKLRGAPKE